MKYLIAVLTIIILAYLFRKIIEILNFMPEYW